MKKYILILVAAFIAVIILPTKTNASGGSDHTHSNEETLSNNTALEYFSSEASSEKYELLVRYGHIHEGESTQLILFVSNYENNRPIDKAKLKITSPQDPKMRFKIS